jgi:hypothetical protein
MQKNNQSVSCWGSTLQYLNVDRRLSNSTFAFNEVEIPFSGARYLCFHPVMIEERQQTSLVLFWDLQLIPALGAIVVDFQETFDGKASYAKSASWQLGSKIRRVPYSKCGYGVQIRRRGLAIAKSHRREDSCLLCCRAHSVVSTSGPVS